MKRTKDGMPIYTFKLRDWFYERINMGFGKDKLFWIACRSSVVLTVPMAKRVIRALQKFVEGKTDDR